MTSGHIASVHLSPSHRRLGSVSRDLVVIVVVDYTRASLAVLHIWQSRYRPEKRNNGGKLCFRLCQRLRVDFVSFTHKEESFILCKASRAAVDATSVMGNLKSGVVITLQIGISERKLDIRSYTKKIF